MNVLRLFQFFTDRAKFQLDETLAFTGFRVMKAVRRTGLSLLLFLVSTFGWTIGTFFLLLSLFFYFSDATQYINPALWTSFVGYAFAVIMTFSGFYLLRKPW